MFSLRIVALALGEKVNRQQSGVVHSRPDPDEAEGRVVFLTVQL